MSYVNSNACCPEIKALFDGDETEATRWISLLVWPGQDQDHVLGIVENAIKAQVLLLTDVLKKPASRKARENYIRYILHYVGASRRSAEQALALVLANHVPCKHCS